MSLIQVDWQDEDQTIIVWKLEGKWDWDEYYGAIDRSRQMIDLVDHEVYMIHHTGESMHLPANALTHFKNYVAKMSSYSQMTIVVSSNIFFKIMFGALQHFMGEWMEFYYIAPTLDEALKLIKKHKLEQAKPLPD